MADKLISKIPQRTTLFKAAPLSAPSKILGSGSATSGLPMSTAMEMGSRSITKGTDGGLVDVTDPKNPKKIDPKTGKTTNEPGSVAPPPGSSGSSGGGGSGGGGSSRSASGGSSGGGSSSRSSSSKTSGSKTSGETKSPPSSIGRDPETGDYIDYSDPTSPKKVDPKTGIPIGAPKPDKSSSGTKSPPSSIGRDPKTGEYVDYSDPTSPRTVDKSGIWVGWSTGGGSSSSASRADRYKDMFSPGSELYKAFAKLSSKEQDHIAGLRGREQFEAMVDAKMIPDGSIFVQDDPNKGWRYQTPEQTDFYRTHRKLPDGKWIEDEDYQSLEPKYKEIARTKGLDAMQDAFDRDHVKLPDGSYIKNEDYQSMDPAWQRVATTEGQKGLDRLVNAQNLALRTLEPYKDKDGNYDVVKYLKDTKGTKGGDLVLKNAGFSEDSIKQASEHASLSFGQLIWRGMTPWDESKGETVAGSGKDSKWLDIRTGKTISDEEHKKIAMSSEADYYVRSTDSAKQLAKNVTIMAAEQVVPGVYAGRHWNDMTDGEKAFNIVLEVATVSPFVGAASRGARLVSTAGKAARLTSAAKAIGREAVGQVMAPVNLIIHPVSSAKTTARSITDLVEHISDFSKLPEVVVYTSYGTTKLRLSDIKNPADAKAARDALMELAAKGERPIVQIGDQVIELARSPLMKELKGGLVHTTPMGEAFEGGLKVAKKPGMPPSEQGLFLSHEPLPRFTKTTAFNLAGGDKPIIYITSREMAEKSIPTAKLYDSPVGKVAEMERKFAVSTDVQPPVQKLYTRIGPEGQVVELWLGKRLSKAQILKLKLMGITESFKSIWTEPITIKNRGVTAGLTKSDIEDVANILKESGNADQARNLVRAVGLSAAMRKPAPALTRVATRVRSSQIAAARKRLGITSRDIQRAIEARTALRTARPVVDMSQVRVVRDGAGAKPARRVSDAPERTGGRPGRTSETVRADPVEDRTPPDECDPVRGKTFKQDTDPGKARSETHDGGEKVKITTTTGEEIEVTRSDLEGAIGWRQGIGWWLILSNYKDRKRAYFVKEPPPGVKVRATGKGSAYKTIQPVKGKGPKSDVHYDLGNRDIIVSNQGRQIKFKPDPGQRTRGDMDLRRPGKPSQRPGLKMMKKGKMLYIPGVGYTRKKPRGRMA